MQDQPTIEIEKVAEKFQYIDGLAWSRSGYLVFADVPQNKIFRMSVGALPSPMNQNSGGASGLAYDLPGRLCICESAARRVSRLDPKLGLAPLAENFEGKKFNAPNDIVVRRDGHVYFTDPAFGSANDHRELAFYGVFHVTPKGELEAAARWQTRPNGVTVSPDGRLLYVTDSDRHAVVAFDLDHAGAASNQRDLIRNVPGVPGGIRTDVNGRLYVGAHGLHIYSAAGKLERTIFEDRNASNCTFGEGDLESLFMASRGDIFRVRLGVKGALQY